MIDVLSNYIENIPPASGYILSSDGETELEYPKFMADVSMIDYSDIFSTVFSDRTSSKVDFNSLMWDFSPFAETVTPNLLKIKFDGLSEDVIYKLKFFIIFHLSRKTKLSSVCLFANNIKRCLATQDYIVDISSLDIDGVCKSVISSDCSESTKKNYLSHLYDFLLFVKDNYEVNFHGYELYKLEDKFKNIKPDTVSYPLIEWPLYNRMMDKALEVSKDESIEFRDRMVASMLVIQMQTGLRTSDVLILKNDDLIIQTAPDGMVSYRMKYKETKTSKKYHTVIIECDISKEAGEAFLNIINLKKKYLPNCSSQYLYVVDEKKEKVLFSFYRRDYATFMYRYLNEDALTPKDYIEKIVYTVRGNGDTPLYIPSPHSFRVNVCTFLMESNLYPYSYIMNRLGHLSDSITKSYNRPRNKTAQLNEITAKVFDAVLKDNVTPLGGRNDGEALKKNMQDFIAKKHVNNVLDIPIENLAQEFKNELQIRSLSGGFCIKVGENSPCNLDGNTNKIPCAFNSCPNQYYFYFNLPETYQGYKDALSMYTIAVDKKRTSQIAKEAQDIAIWSKRIDKQLNQLKDIIEKQGKDKVLEKNPAMDFFITDFDALKKEVAQWL